MKNYCLTVARTDKPILVYLDFSVGQGTTISVGMHET